MNVRDGRGDLPPDEPEKYKFNPHGDRITGRDWSFLTYLLALSILPLIASVVICVVLFMRNPNFDNFEEGPASMENVPTSRGPVNEQDRKARLAPSAKEADSTDETTTEAEQAQE
ncbi:hypothetical protein [Rubinisphaera sp. JC750]|uniref:hypothetical protein n=1 Tax=Rubinisphaera sp. JC750 TaxID=2898658 RepID=UPI001F201826|nr:hypothetical protein [Rubinisphaera sp. JC750]